MMGSFLSRVLIMVFGYAYPAYECFKVVENNKQEIEQLLFWCQYWILVAMLTVCERVGDNLISWLPLYSEAKLAFFIYLWYSKTKGTLYVYDSFFRPFMTKHEPEIDRSLSELRVKTVDIAFVYWQRASTYGLEKFFEILQYISSQSASQLYSDQQEPNVKSGKPRPSNPNSQDTEQKQSKELNSSFYTSLSQNPEPSSELKTMPIGPVSSLENENLDSSKQETVSKDPIQLMHGSWRLFQSSANH